MKFVYYFKAEDQNTFKYDVEIKEDTLEIIHEPKSPPSWAKLENHQCSHCPLNKETTPLCPIAKNLSKLIQFFSNQRSVERYRVAVDTPERRYYADTDLQKGLGSLFGLIMATSGCPSMESLKPMARYHLPFASAEETIIRSLGSFLIRKYLENKKVEEDDFKELEALYDVINTINRQILARIKHLMEEKGAGESNQNAIIILDNLANLLNLEFTDNFELIRPLYPSLKDI